MTKQEKQKTEGHEEVAQEVKAQGEAASSDTPPPAKANRVEISRAEYEELLRKVDEFAQLQDRLLRSAADFDNARKRLAKEREEFVRFGLEEVIRDLLPVLDHFELALAHLQVEDEKTKSIRDGFLLIQKQLVQTLADRGLKRIETIGRTFDPHFHEAVSHVTSQDKSEGLILEEVLAGYELNGKLLRPTKVKISTRGEIASGPDEKTEELT